MSDEHMSYISYNELGHNMKDNSCIKCGFTIYKSFVIHDDYVSNVKNGLHSYIIRPEGIYYCGQYSILEEKMRATYGCENLIVKDILE
jgi:hypothetical protein